MNAVEEELADTAADLIAHKMIVFGLISSLRKRGLIDAHDFNDIFDFAALSLDQALDEGIATALLHRARRALDSTMRNLTGPPVRDIS